ncbi:MAG: hypothetical protein P4L93_09590 [Coriobacteriia bacterium]|nr:hypothetical protein [Coriobacteriia bacterium]
MANALDYKVVATHTNQSHGGAEMGTSSSDRNQPFRPKSGPLAGRVFPSYDAYRRAVVANAFDVMKLKLERDRQAALRALSIARAEHLSPSEAARQVGTTRETVLRHTASAWVKAPSGRYQATKSDRLSVPMRILTRDGMQLVRTTSSRQRSLVGSYWDAVRRYTHPPSDASALAKLEGVSAGGYYFETDPLAIDEWANRGELDFDDIYALGED